MKEQTDFWKPKPYDFEAIVAGVDAGKLAMDYGKRAGAHVNPGVMAQSEWDLLERHHDIYDRSYFSRAGLDQAADVWDNRRKVSAQ